METMIEVKNVSKSFNGRMVLSHLDLTIFKGETLVIIGRSGCGKSVLLKHIMGLMKADEGEVVVDGRRSVGCFLHPQTTATTTIAGRPTTHLAL